MFKRGGIKYRQKNLADDLKVQAATVSRWINDKETPDDVNIRSLARLFGVKPSFIYKKLGRESPKGIDDENALTEIIYSLQQKTSPRLLREWINLYHVLTDEEKNELVKKYGRRDKKSQSGSVDGNVSGDE